MATNEIGDYSAVATPTEADEFYTVQDGVARVITTTDILATTKEFPEKSNSDMGTTDYVMGTQSGSEVKITLNQILTYIRTLQFGFHSGGTGSAGNRAEADRYTVSTDAWDARTDMTTARSYMAGGSSDGDAYIIGGLAETAEILKYVMTGDTWSDEGDLLGASRARYGYIGASRSDAIYLMGGVNALSGRFSDSFIYRPSLTTTHGMTDMGWATSEGAACIASLRYVVRFGGVGGSETYNDTEEYYGVLDTWTRKNYLVGGARKSLTALNLGSITNKDIHIFGGELNVPYTLVAKFDRVKNSWTTETAMSTATTGMAGSTLKYKGYLYGGSTAVTTYTQECNQYNGTAQTWISQTDYSTTARGYGFGCALTA